MDGISFLVLIDGTGISTTNPQLGAYLAQPFSQNKHLRTYKNWQRRLRPSKRDLSAGHSHI